MEYNFTELNKKLKRILQGNPRHETITKEELQYVENHIANIEVYDDRHRIVRKSVSYAKLLQEIGLKDL